MRKYIIKQLIFLSYSLSSFLWLSACSTKKESQATNTENPETVFPATSTATDSFTPPTTKYGVRPVVKYGPPPAYLDSLKKDTTATQKDTIPPRPVTKYGVRIN